MATLRYVNVPDRSRGKEKPRGRYIGRSQNFKHVIPRGQGGQHCKNDTRQQRQGVIGVTVFIVLAV